jgi:hypothetical protein
MFTKRFEISAQTLFNLMGDYPNPDDDTPRGPFDPIEPVSTALTELVRAYAHRPISDPPGWERWRANSSLLSGLDLVAGRPDPTPWLFGKPDPTPWLAALIARSHAVELLELDGLARHLPEQQQQLEGRAAELSQLAIEDCGTLTPNARFLAYLKKRGIKWPPKGWTDAPRELEWLLMANEFHAVSLHASNERIAELAETVSAKLLENGLGVVE